MQGLYDGRYKLKRFSCLNNIFNVVSCTVSIGGNSESIPDGFYTQSKLAAAVQVEMRKQDATATVTYNTTTDKYSITMAANGNVIFSELLCILMGIDRRQYETAAVTSVRRPNIAPFPALTITFSSTATSDKFVMTTEAPYASMIIYEPAVPVEITFFAATNPTVKAVSGSYEFPLQNVSVELELA